jgi:acylphosphatase
MTEQRRRLHMIVRGLVQGVFYRASARDQARLLLLGGWVRNLPDGSVEIVAEGPEETLMELLAWCRQGPPAARVDHIESDWSAAENAFAGFHVRY